MITTRPVWETLAKDGLNFEQDMNRRGCVLPAVAGRLKWVSQGITSKMRITTVINGFEIPLGDAPFSVRTKVTDADLELLADAADAAMLAFINAEKAK